LATIVLCFITALVVVLISTPALIKVAYLKRLVDEPGEERKLHVRRVPTIGGIIIFAATLFAFLLWSFSEFSEIPDPARSINDFKYIAACMLILFFIGVKDDIIGMAPTKKLMGHLVVAFILVIMADIRITSMHGIMGINELNEWASILLSVFTYTVIVNAINLIDGVDGLASGVGSITCLAYGIWFFNVGATEDAILAFSLGGALIGFLMFNFAPAKIFMGDSGSLTIGLIVSVLSIKLIEFDINEVPLSMTHISKPVFAMAALVYPLIDTLRIFIYRATRGISPFAADKNHLHHRLLELGFTHGQTTFIIYGFSIFIIGLAALLPLEPTISFLVVGGTAILVSLVPVLLVRSKRKKQSISHAG